MDEQEEELGGNKGGRGGEPGRTGKRQADNGRGGARARRSGQSAPQARAVERASSLTAVPGASAQE
jgi:hypothetical protein